ncbi:MAG: serine/threonine-protein kinase, partial [Longimicrobiales bacterium]
MSPDRWRRVEEIFHAVAELPASERTTFLDRECEADAELRAEVESLLAADTTESSLVKSVIENEAEHLATERDQSVIGQHIGPYRVIREIGQGGMGTVYLAARDDQQFEKEVALKLVRLGMDTEFLVKRFRQERQILALLEHPNIARLLEGGVSADGRPYFAMEYVDGAPITKFCEDRQLPINERLWLFRRVCRAVDYAHQKLVVHRDLKPSNILVTPDGEPKLLDFGIAKLLSDHEASSSAKAMAMTLTLMRVMTPDYASPEQVRGEPSSTVTDVYSLGIVLYEILTGKRPHRFRSYTPSEIERVICREEPEKPSTAALRSDAAGERKPAGERESAS